MARPVRLRLEHDGFEWAGTFQVALRAIVTDILSDGTPFGAQLLLEDETTGDSIVREVTVVSINEDFVVGADDFAWPRGSILAIEVY